MDKVELDRKVARTVLVLLAYVLAVGIACTAYPFRWALLIGPAEAIGLVALVLGIVWCLDHAGDGL